MVWPLGFYGRGIATKDSEGSEVFASAPLPLLLRPKFPHNVLCALSPLIRIIMAWRRRCAISFHFHTILEAQMTQLADAPTVRASLIPPWAQIAPGLTTNANLPQLLDFAAASYGRHTDWFHRHREAGIRNLGAVLASEFAVATLYSSSSNRVDLRPFAVGAFLLLAAIIIPLAWSTLGSCRTSFKAALESVVLISKCIWALGLASGVRIAADQIDLSSCPFPSDELLYVKRYFSDACVHATEYEFVQHHLGRRNTTYFHTRVTLWVFCLGAVVFGVLGAIWVLHGK
jgi:hypothetical protein